MDNALADVMAQARQQRLEQKLDCLIQELNKTNTHLSEIERLLKNTPVPDKTYIK